LSYIKREDKPLIIVCDACGEQREMQYALTHGTHRAFGGDVVRHYCKACADDLEDVCA
jgi:phage/plasmid primase-like uncharacterized protein